MPPVVLADINCNLYITSVIMMANVFYWSGLSSFYSCLYLSASIIPRKIAYLTLFELFTFILFERYDFNLIWVLRELRGVLECFVYHEIFFSSWKLCDIIICTEWNVTTEDFGRPSLSYPQLIRTYTYWIRTCFFVQFFMLLVSDERDSANGLWRAQKAQPQKTVRIWQLAQGCHLYTSAMATARERFIREAVAPREFELRFK